MTVESEDYKLDILEYAVNQCINRLFPKSCEDALSVILYQSNEVVWRVATDIYTKSGYQIDFLFIRDILNLRIEPLRNKIAEEEKIRKAKELEKAKIEAELEAQRQIREAKEKRIRKEKEAEEAKIRAKLEVERLEKIVEQQRIKQEQKAEKEKLGKQRENARQKKLQVFHVRYPNISLDIFLKIEKLITEELVVEEERITLDSILSKDLGADSLDIEELVQAIEEEFDTEIPNDFTGTNWISCICGDYSRLESITVKEIVDIVCEKIQ